MRGFRSTTRAQRLALVVGGVVALGIAASASAVSFTNASPITINDRAANPPSCGTFSANLSAPITINDGTTPPTPASPYPSAGTIGGLGGTLTDVNVRLNGFSHTFPDDVDILLVGPNGATVVLMSDVGGGTAVTGLNITLDDAAAPSLPDAGPLTTGTFKPTNAAGTGTDTFPAPAPAGPYGSTLAALNGGTPNGTWSLYVVDDQAQDSGSISGGWTLTFTTAGCPPPPPPAPPAAAAPYPSTLGVSGVSGTVTDANVTLNGFSHTYPDDVDALLVGPTGTTTILMSDVGGGTDAVNLSITLDDEAASLLPDAGPLVSGSFKPTNLEVDEPFPSPAPAGPYGAALTAFDGTNPNGTWSLYVVDDANQDSGSITGGWTLTLAGPTAVALRSFAAHPGASGVALAWRTASETGIAGFELFRSSAGSKPVRLNRALIPAKRTGSAQGASYRYLDRSARAGASYTYRLQLVGPSGARSPGGSVSLYAGR